MQRNGANASTQQRAARHVPYGTPMAGSDTVYLSVVDGAGQCVQLYQQPLSGHRHRSRGAGHRRQPAESGQPLCVGPGAPQRAGAQQAPLPDHHPGHDHLRRRRIGRCAPRLLSASWAATCSRRVISRCWSTWSTWACHRSRRWICPAGRLPGLTRGSGRRRRRRACTRRRGLGFCHDGRACPARPSPGAGDRF